ncbi:MAG: AMP-dependent synthetase/ligase [Actinomycetales bacterium]
MPREHAVPPMVQVAPDAAIVDYLYDNAAAVPQGVAVRTRTGDGRWQDVSHAELLERVEALAKGLVAAGVGPGDRVGLMSRTRLEWTLCDFAIWVAGGVTVPIYETSSAEQVAWILSDSGAVGCFVESAKHLGTVEAVHPDLAALRHVWHIDGGALDRLADDGHAVDGEQLRQRRSTIGSESVATIIYTSGTTGRPKGCELTHGNFRSEVDSILAKLPEVFDPSAQGSLLLFLPLAHVLARMVQVLAIAGRMPLGHSPDVKNLVPDLQSFCPTFLLAVPRVFEKVYNSAEQKAHSEGRGKIFAVAADTAVAWSQSLDRGGPSLGLRLRHALFDRLVYAKLRAAMGGRVQWAVSGGAPLGERLGHFFRGIGVCVLEGYGLTETTAAATVNLPSQQKIGTVGPPLPGVAVRIADDGEVLLKGGIVFPRYFNNEQASGEALDDGWFRTGDLGELDDDGFLRITGRKKELIVTAGGKNVAPAVLEDRLRAHVLVSQCVVVGDGRPFVGALVTLDEEALPGWLQRNGRPAAEPAALVDDPAVVAAIQEAVDDANRAVSQAEAIRRFRILPVDFTEAGGQLTPSMKLKRSVVMKEFADEVERLYSA